MWPPCMLNDERDAVRGSGETWRKLDGWTAASTSRESMRRQCPFPKLAGFPACSEESLFFAALLALHTVVSIPVLPLEFVCHCPSKRAARECASVPS